VTKASRANNAARASDRATERAEEVELTEEVVVELGPGATAADLAMRLGLPGSGPNAAVAAVLDGRVVDLSERLEGARRARILVASSDEGRQVLRHSAAHVMAQAVTDLWPGAKYAIGPAVEDGFYYDFELPAGERIGASDLERIEARMAEIVAEDQPFVREELSLEEGRRVFSSQPYKLEIIAAISSGAEAEGPGPGPEGGKAFDAESGAPRGRVSLYRNSDRFVDLCRGPHVPSTRFVANFKLTRVAGAYWRGDERRQQLQRVYGTAFESPEALQEYLERLEEAERRDHRRIGAELDLFSFPAETGPGLAIFHPRGGLVRRLMEDASRERHQAAGYEFVFTPHVTKADLFEASGHLEWFSEGMFPPMELEEGQRYYVKPMNCPFHILVYRSRQRSYKELPLRLFELGTVYRYEKSGVVHGLTRVRGMTQDDSHIFCTHEQMNGELAAIVDLVLEVLGDYGLDDFYVELSTRPEGKAAGSVEEWDEATEALRQVAIGRGLELVLDEGGGAFYGPKISVQARDAIGRSWQVSTVQLDFQLPRRFGLEYVAVDNSRKRPVMIHRALFGTVERFLAILLEHYAGALPPWLCPVQVAVLPVRDDHDGYAASVVEACAKEGLRAVVDRADEPLGARIRKQRMDKVPWVLVVGDEDRANGSVGVNRRGAPRPERGVDLQAFVAEAASVVQKKALLV
jgi:threonyl-tRNA synthetase